MFKQRKYCEIYEIYDSINSYYYTSYDRKVDFNGVTYEPINIERSEIKKGMETTKTDIQVNITNSAAALELFKTYISVRSIRIKITLLDLKTNESLQLYLGKIIERKFVNENMSRLTAKQFSETLNATIGKYNYQFNCNKTQYSPQCGLKMEDHSFDVVIQSISEDGTDIVITNTGQPNDLFRTGFMYDPLQIYFGYITEHTGTNIKLYEKIEPMKVGDTMKITKGCKNIKQGCRQFGDAHYQRNFLGFELIPDSDYKFDIES